MDPLLFSLIMAWLVVRGAEEVPYAIRGKTSPRMAAMLAKARDTRAAASKPNNRRTAARDFFSAWWADAWESGHNARTRMRDSRPQKKAEDRLWWQRAARAAQPVRDALRDLAQWATTGKLPDLPGLDDHADFAKAAENAKTGNTEQQPPRPEDGRAAADPPPRAEPAPEPPPGPVRATATRIDEQLPSHDHPQQVDDDRPQVLDGEVVCDSGISCRSSELGPQEAIARGLCSMCGGRKELVWNFGGEHGHTPCPECRGTGKHTPFTSPRLQLEASTSKENPRMAANAETTRITQAIAFATEMAEEARGGVTSMETFTQSLSTGEVTGKPLELAANAQELYAQIAGVFDREREELQRHLVIAESYAAVGNEAGSKDFNTDA